MGKKAILCSINSQTHLEIQYNSIQMSAGYLMDLDKIFLEIWMFDKKIWLKSWITMKNLAYMISFI